MWKEGFYLDKKEQKCIKQTGIFNNWKESLDGEKCSICNNYFYFNEEGLCTSINYCSKDNKFGNVKNVLKDIFLQIMKMFLQQKKKIVFLEIILEYVYHVMKILFKFKR